MIRIFFARPGAGKTTQCIAFAKKNMRKRKYGHVYLNFPHSLPGAYICDLEGLGDWTFPENSYIALDEAGIEYNNRSFKNFPKEAIYWYKMHRHYKVTIDFFSQSHDDVDVTLRRLAAELWLLYRIGPWTLGRRIYKHVGVDQETHQIIDQYSMASMWWLLIWPLQLGYPFNQKFTLTFRPFYYRYFDTHSRKDLAVRDFPQVPVPERKFNSIIKRIKLRFRRQK